MKRREFLKNAGVLAGGMVLGEVISTLAMSSRAEAATGLPLQSLFASLNSEEALLLIPSNRQFAAYQVAYNKRTLITPQVRALCKTPEAVATALQWAKSNQVPFAIRGGGHSYEGFSQSRGLVIDVRLMNSVQVNAATKQASIGAGLSLGQVYKALSDYKMVIPAGSGPTVGISGHTLGGGFGMLARPLGLACDNLESLEIVDARGRILRASENENADLFWACRGGGSGSLGVVTKLDFKTHELSKVSVFGASWTVPRTQALKIVKIWQEWAPDAPEAITSIFRLSRKSSGLIAVRCAGQSTDSESKLLAEVKHAFRDFPSDSLKTSTLSFIDAVKHFSGGEEYESIFMKAKSDYLFQPMSDQGIQTLIDGLLGSPTVIAAMLDGYGGAVNRVASDAMAFAHRAGTRYSIQYYTEWHNAADTPRKLHDMRELYASMRPYVSGASYMNYCDRDLENFAEAYWGANLNRLKQVKRAFDPENFFNGGQGIPFV